MSTELRIVSSLEKIFPDQEPTALPVPLTVLQDDSVSFQIALLPQYNLNLHNREDYTVSLESPIAELISLRSVTSVPVYLTTTNPTDGNYISDQPGMYPDLLEPLPEDQSLIANNGFWSSLWIEVTTSPSTPAGTYPVTITLTHGEETYTAETTVEVIGAVLPAQTLKHTEWIHEDGLAQYYHLEVWSEPFWEALRKELLCAAHRGINMLLTPIFTPALDTKVGHERLTVQLVDITVTKGSYSFNFQRLKRFIDMAMECGIQYFEMAHLFSQWGAKKCPKIMAYVDGTYTRIFGWDTDSTGEAYNAFLNAFLPELTQALTQWGIRDRVVFHISDEPSEEALPQYRTCRDMVKELLNGFIIMDAMSEYSFFEQGVCEHPVVATNAVNPFLQGRRPEDFWVYYCVSQNYKVSNRFIAMPSARTRIIGLQLYKFNVAGFLHWGFNFYNSMLSVRPINPFCNTDADHSFPAGDSFIVYPGANYEPLESLRLVVFSDALHDLRALRLLESMTSREHVMALLEDGLKQPLSFTDYPHDSEYQLRLMHRVHQEIKEHC